MDVKKLKSGAMSATKFGMIGLILLTILTVFLGVYRIDEGHVGVVKRFGNAFTVVDPGLHLKMPYADTVVEIEVRERAYVAKLAAASQDPLEIPVTVTVNWLVKRNEVLDLYKNFGGLEQFEKRIIAPRLNDSVKRVTASFVVNDLLRKRGEYREASKLAFEGSMPSNIQTTGFSITNIGFPPEYTKAIRDKQVAREESEREKFVLEKQRLTSAQITQSAEAQRDADKARADGKAYEIEVEGKAKAEAIRIMGEALSKNPLVVDYKKVERWGGNFPTTFMGGTQGANVLWSLPANK